MVQVNKNVQKKKAKVKGQMSNVKMIKEERVLKVERIAEWPIIL